VVAGLAYLVLPDATSADSDEPAAAGSHPARAAAGWIAAPEPPAIDPAATDIPAGELRLEGEAIDADHHPIAGATITLNGSRAISTDADGAFAFDHLAEGGYQLTAEKDTLYARERVVLSASSKPAMLTLRPGTTLVVHVVADGQPVSGASVEVMGYERATDATGTVRFRGVELNSTVVSVTAEPYMPVRVEIATGDDARATVEKTIALEHGAPVAGIVVDQDGRPVPDAKVLYHMSVPGYLPWYEIVEVDAQGGWQINRVGAGKLLVEGYSQFHTATAEIAVAVDGKHPTTGVIVRVARGATVSGVVVDASGKPVAGASVSATGGSTQTDGAGRFELTGLEAGPCELSATTPTQGSEVHPLQLPKGGRVEARLVLVDTHITGSVKTSRGEPVAGVSIRATRVQRGASGSATTNDRGEFDLGDIPPGDYELTAVRDGDREEHPRTRGAHSGDRGVELVLPDRATIAGRVVLDGKPVDYFGVAFTDDPGGSYPTPDVVRAPDGRFSETHLQPGTWSVQIVGPAFVRKTIGDVRVTEGQVTDLGDITVERGRSLSGRVRDERGLPVAGALVTLGKGHDPNDDATLSQLSRGARTARSDADGNYRIDGIEPDDGGELMIGATDDRGIAAAQRVEPTASTIDLVIERTGAIAGVVANARGQITVFAISARGASYDATPDPDHEFVLDRLPPGDYTVRLEGTTLATPVHVMVTGGATTRVDFELGAAVHLMIRADLPEPCRQMTIESAEDGDGSHPVLAVLDCDHGVGEHADVAPGRYRVCVHFTVCTDVEVTASPAHQLVTLEAPPPDPTDDAASPAD
jgi:protocatechuate 3,4-dioxygenase beta subunit